MTQFLGRNQNHQKSLVTDSDPKKLIAKCKIKHEQVILHNIKGCSMKRFYFRRFLDKLICNSEIWGKTPHK